MYSLYAMCMEAVLCSQAKNSAIGISPYDDRVILFFIKGSYANFADI
jgi:hypothetical protein